MKVFLSWSQEPSKQYAQLLMEWLPNFLQYVEPFYSEDIEKGTRGMNIIANELKLTDFGILCLTEQNTKSPWINFEAGALSKLLSDSHVCPLLFGITKGEISGPLGQFQGSYPDKVDFLRLLKSINDSAGDKKIKDSIFENVFEALFPKFEEKIKEIKETYTIEHPSIDSQKDELKIQREILEEILETTRSLKRSVNTQVSLSNRAIGAILPEIEHSDSLNSSYVMSFVSEFVLNTDLRLRAILKEATFEIKDSTIIIKYPSPKHKWHAVQVSGKIEELERVAKKVFGSDFNVQVFDFEELNLPF